MNLRGVLAALLMTAALAGCAQNRNAGERIDCCKADSTPAQVEQQQVQTPKKVSILGDSYSTFEGWVTSPKFISWYKPVPKPGRDTDVTDVNQTWWKIFIDRNGYELEKNNSYSGATICNTGYGKNDYTDRSFITRLVDLGNPDIIFIFGGTNDSWADSPIGEYVWSGWSKKQLYSYRPATAYMLSHLKEQHPDAQIVFLINDMLKPEIVESTKKICDHYGVKYIELEGIEKKSDHPDSRGMVQIVEQIEASLAE